MAPKEIFYEVITKDKNPCNPKKREIFIFNSVLLERTILVKTEKNNLDFFRNGAIHIK